MFNFLKKKSENDKKVELCKNFFAEFTDNNIEKHFLNQLNYQKQHFYISYLKDNLLLSLVYSTPVSIFTYLLWKANPELFSNLWFSIPYFTILVSIALSIIFFKDNKTFTVYFLKNIWSSFKINKFVRKYFSSDEKTVTIFKFLKHTNFNSSTLDKLLQESIRKKFTYSTIYELNYHLYNYRKLKIYDQIENKSVEQSIDFLTEKIDQEIQFFSK